MNSRYARYYTYIKPIIKNKLVKNYSFLAFSLIASGIFAVFALEPTVKTILVLQQTVTEQQQLFEQVETKGKNLGLAIKNLQSIDPKIKKNLIALLPYTSQLPSTIVQINSLVKVSQASVSGLQFQPTDLDPSPKTLNKDAQLKEVVLTLNVAGTYPQLINILNNISQLDRLVLIKSVNFNKGESNSLLMSISAKIFYYRQ